MLRFTALLAALVAVGHAQTVLYPSSYRQISYPLSSSSLVSSVSLPQYQQSLPLSSFTYQPFLSPVVTAPISTIAYRLSPQYSIGQTYQYTYPNSISYTYQQRGVTPLINTLPLTTRPIGPLPTSSVYSRGGRALALSGGQGHGQQQSQNQIQYQTVPQQQGGYFVDQSQSQQQYQSQNQQQTVQVVPVQSIQAVPTVQTISVPISTTAGYSTGLDQVRIHQNQAQQQQIQPLTTGSTGYIQIPQQSQQPQYIQAQPIQQQLVQQQVQPQVVAFAPVQASEQQPQFVATHPTAHFQQATIPSVPISSYAPQVQVVGGQQLPLTQTIPIVHGQSQLQGQQQGQIIGVGVGGHHQESLGHHQVSHVSIPGQVGIGGGYTSSAFYEAAPSVGGSTSVVIPAELSASDVKVAGKVVDGGYIHQGQQQGQVQSQQQIQGQQQVHHHLQQAAGVQSYEG